MYRSTLCSYFNITLLNIMQIKFKHILLFVTICFLIYLDFEWFMSVDLSTISFEGNTCNSATFFTIINSILTCVIFIIIMTCTKIPDYIEKLLNKNIFKL